MSEIDQGGFVYPFAPTDRSGQIGDFNPGITLRQHYAGIVAPTVVQGHFDDLRAGMPPSEDWRLVVAKECFKLADAMIEAGKQ